MQRKFIGNLLLLLALNFLIKPLWIFGVDRQVQNVLGAESYGLYFALLNFSFLFNILLDVGITNFNNRNISQNEQLLKKHLFALFNLKLLLSALYAFVLLSVALFIGYSKSVFPLLITLGVNQVLLSLILFVRSNYAGLQLFKVDSVLSVLDRFLMVILGLILLYWDSGSLLSIQNFAFVQTASYFLVLIIALAFLAKRSGPYRPKVKWVFSAALLKKSFPFALLVLLMTFYNRTDSVMLERLHPNGSFEAGVYAQGYRLFDSVNMIAYLFATLLLPMFSRLTGEKKSVKPLVLVALKTIGVFAIGVSVYCIVCAPEIITLLYKDNEYGAALCLAILMANILPVATTYIYGTLLTAGGELRALNQMACGGVLLNIILNLVLIPKYGAFGAAVATLITQVATAGYQLILSAKKFELGFPLMVWFKLGVLGVVAFGLLKIAFSFALNQLLTFSLYTVVVGALGFILLISVKDIKSLLILKKISQG